MPRLIFAMFGIAIAALGTSGCGYHDPNPVDLPAEGIPYTLRLTIYTEEGTIAQPFALSIANPKSPSESKQILSAEQCKNVDAIYDRKQLVIFYDELVLNSFGSYPSNPMWPQPLLCDNHYEVCRLLRKTLIDGGLRPVALCTLRK